MQGDLMRGLVASYQKWRPVFLTAACFLVEALTWWKSVPPRTDLDWGNDYTSVGHSWVRTFQLYVLLSLLVIHQTAVSLKNPWKSSRVASALLCHMRFEQTLPSLWTALCCPFFSLLKSFWLKTVQPSSVSLLRNTAFSFWHSLGIIWSFPE